MHEQSAARLQKLQRLCLYAVRAAPVCSRFHSGIGSDWGNARKTRRLNSVSKEIHLEVWELIDFESRRIRSYSYEVYQRGEKIGWYDHWEHPEIPSLAATFPHHKHVRPNLRDNRVPAPDLSFETPNLDFVLKDLVRELAA